MDLNNISKRRYRALLVLVLLGPMMVGITAYAVQNLLLQNSATITTGNPNFFMVTGVISTTDCSTITGYSNSGLNIQWGSLSQGSVAQQFVCLENTGSPHVISISNNLPSTYGSITATIGTTGTPANGQTINHNSFILLNFTWTVDASAPSGAAQFSISVQ